MQTVNNDVFRGVASPAYVFSEQEFIDRATLVKTSFGEDTFDMLIPSKDFMKISSGDSSITISTVSAASGASSMVSCFASGFEAQDIKITAAKVLVKTNLFFFIVFFFFSRFEYLYNCIIKSLFLQ